MSNRVPKLHGKQSPISKNADKTSSQLMNFVRSGERQRKERKRHSSGFLTHSWNVYVGQIRGKRQRKQCWFRRHEVTAIAKL